MRVAPAFRSSVVVAFAAAFLCAPSPAPLFAQSDHGATTTFDVVKQGFHFINYWSGDVLIDVPLIGQVDVGDTTYGLCGGMVFTALDTYVANAVTPLPSTPPQQVAVPASGTPLRSAIYNRQLDSMKLHEFALVRQLLDWAWRPTQSGWFVTGLLEKSDREFRKWIVPALDAGRPIPLCLVRADIDDYVAPNLTTIYPDGYVKNHQVLAIGYRRCHGNATMHAHWAIDVYDPNYPMEVMSLHWTDEQGIEATRVDASGRHVTDPDDATANRVDSFRGFFTTPYVFEHPYWAGPATISGAGRTKLEALFADPEAASTASAAARGDGFDATVVREADAAKGADEAVALIERKIKAIEERIAGLEGRRGAAKR